MSTFAATYQNASEVGSAEQWVELFRSQNVQLTKALTDIQSALAKNVEFNQQNTEASHNLADDFSQLASESESICEQTHQLNDQVDDSHSKVGRMDDEAQAIMDILHIIKQIADRTNLLALNATIEAARAGEAGKGFGVVANEVKELSKQTRDAVGQISKRIESIEENSANVKKAMETLRGTSNQVQSMFQQFNERIVTTADENRRILERLTGSSQQVFMSLAKLDHVLWKVNTYLSVVEQRPAFRFVDHHNCRLGKWYYQGDGKQSFSSRPGYREMENAHAQVHDATSDVFKLLEADASLQEFVAPLQRMEDGSTNVFRFIDRMSQG